MNQMVRMITPDAICMQLQDSIKSILTRTTLSLEEAVTELERVYRDHEYVRGTFDTATLSVFGGIAFAGMVCGEHRTIAVF